MWDRAWLETEYTEKHRSTGDIAAEVHLTDNAVLFWLNKHGIARRSISEARAVKKWGHDLSGEHNPMHGRRGVLNPNWRGGLTPARQAIYSKSEMRQAIQDVYRRDKRCRLCDATEPLEVHHIDPFSQSPLLVMDIGNMIVLCKKCHRKIRGKEQSWKRRLFKLISQKGG
jgi:predicted restriction endonuclease